MNAAEENTKSVWMETEVAEAPSLDGNQSADVVIIGSGIAGLSTAYELTGRGRSVIILEDRGVARAVLGLSRQGSQFAPDGAPLNGPAVTRWRISAARNAHMEAAE